jgi:hypothetical protein
VNRYGARDFALPDRRRRIKGARRPTQSIRPPDGGAIEDDL